MKKYYAIAIGIWILPALVFAQESNTYTLSSQQKGLFESHARIAENEFQVPTLVDVPLSFAEGTNEIAVVTDIDENIIPSTIVSDVQKEPLELKVEDTFSGSASTMIDGDHTTFREYPFFDETVLREEIVSVVDEQDNEMRLQEKESITSTKNYVMIDVYGDRAFKSDSFTMYFDDHISYPTHVRVTEVMQNGSEKILLPEKLFTQNTVVFPEGDSDHYRIELKYKKPLRINEIVFHEKDAPQKTDQFVRFIAQPQKAYNIYFDVYENVRIDQGEQPNFYTQQVVQKITPQIVKENPSYKKIDTDGDGVIDRLDNCVDIKNAQQIDKDGNSIGDACEDFDRDGIPNANDNCPDHANRSQADTDHDAIGDACDGVESRFMERNSWIPYVALLIISAVVAGLIIKTLKKE